MAGYPNAKFRYKVEIDGIEAGGFTEVTGSDISIEAIEYREGDMTAETPMKVPGLKKYGNLTLKQGRNLLQLVTKTSVPMDGTTLEAAAPIVDCVKVETEGVVIWDANRGLPASNY